MEDRWSERDVGHVVANLKQKKKMMPSIPFIYFLICGISGLIMWFKMLGIMKGKGEEVNYFWTSPKQLIDFNKIIKEETDEEKKRKYQWLLWGQVLLIPIYIIGMYVLFRTTV